VACSYAREDSLPSARRHGVIWVSKTERYGLSRICFDMTRQATSLAKVSSGIQNSATVSIGYVLKRHAQGKLASQADEQHTIACQVNFLLNGA
jgi:hypothetical protein